MNAVQLRYFALISACNARIEGMKAENLSRTSRGLGLAYDEAAFAAKAVELERLAADVVCV